MLRKLIKTRADGTVWRPAAEQVAAARGVALTVAGLAAVDFGVFQLAGVWGWVATGVSLLALDYSLDKG